MSYWGTTKPPYPTPIDSGAALASGLIAAWAMNEGTGATAHNAVAATGGNLTLNGSAAWAAGGGLNCTATGAGASVTTPAALKLQVPLSWFVRLKQASAPDANSDLFEVSYDNANGSPYVGYSSYYDGAASLRMGWNDGSNLRGFNGTNPSSGVMADLGSAITHLPSDLATLYLNGVSNNTSGLAIPASIGYAATSLVLVGQAPWGSATSPRATIDVVYVWNRALAAADFASLHADPYQVFAAPVALAAGIAPALVATGRIGPSLVGLPGIRPG